MTAALLTLLYCCLALSAFSIIVGVVAWRSERLLKVGGMMVLVAGLAALVWAC